MDAPRPWTCSACTFVNPEGVGQCTMCEQGQRPVGPLPQAGITGKSGGTAQPTASADSADSADSLADSAAETGSCPGLTCAGGLFGDLLDGMSVPITSVSVVSRPSGRLLSKSVFAVSIQVPQQFEAMHSQFQLCAKPSDTASDSSKHVQNKVAAAAAPLWTAAAAAAVASQIPPFNPVAIHDNKHALEGMLHHICAQQQCQDMSQEELRVLVKGFLSRFLFFWFEGSDADRPCYRR